MQTIPTGVIASVAASYGRRCTEDIYQEFPLAPGSLLEPPFEYDDPRLLSSAPHRLNNGYY